MTSSMTAFARVSDQGEWGSAVWELRSVNHRYLESTWRLPEGLRDLEIPLRQMLKTNLHRGKVDCQLQFTPGPAVGVDIQVNEPLVQALVVAQQQIAPTINNHKPFNPIDVLKWPGVIEQGAKDLDVGKQAVLDLFQQALTQLQTVRKKEGQAIETVLRERTLSVLESLNTILSRYPDVLVNWKTKLQARFEEAQIQLDVERLEQEMVLLVQKLDIAEECDRLKIHVEAINENFKQTGAVGRRLDFLFQELNREANTIASKSCDAHITQAAVEMKVLIEQMREQVQNVE